MYGALFKLAGLVLRSPTPSVGMDVEEVRPLAPLHSPAPASLVLLGGVRMVDVGMYVVEVRYLGIWSERKSHSEALGGGRGSLAGF